MSDATKMKALPIVGAVCAVVLCIAAVVAFITTPRIDSSLTVAATVNGAPIYEEDVSASIERQRQQMGFDDDAEWAQFLAANNLTPESLRSQILDGMITQELVRSGAAQLGVKVDQAQVDEYIALAAENQGGNDQLEQALEDSHFTMESYRQSVEDLLLQQNLYDHFVETAKIDEQDAASAAQYYAAQMDGAKRSSHILIMIDGSAGDDARQAARDEAQDVLDKIKSGELSFEDAVAEYSDDTTSAERGGDVGWDRTTTFVTAYQDALDGLSEGELSDVVETEFGYHIILCTDAYEAPEEVSSLDDLPENMRDAIQSSLAEQVAGNAFSAWIQELRDSADITINDMPADVPYNVDMSSVETEPAIPEPNTPGMPGEPAEAPEASEQP